MFALAQGVLSVNRCVRFFVLVAAVEGGSAVAQAGSWHFSDWKADQSAWSVYSIDIYGQTYTGQMIPILDEYQYTPDGYFTMGPPMGGTTYYRYKLDLTVVPPPNLFGCYGKLYYVPVGGTKTYIGTVNATWVP